MATFALLSYGANAVLGILAVLLAALVLLNAPARSANRTLALVLFFEGVTNFTTGCLLAVSLELHVARAMVAVTIWSAMLLPFAYLLFLGQAIQQRWMRPLRSRPVVGALSLCMVALTMPLFVPGGFAWTIQIPVQIAGNALLLLTALFGSLAAFIAFRRSPIGSTARRQMAFYFAAFLLRDITWLYYSTLFLLDPGPTTAASPWDFVLYDTGFLGMMALLTYGFLKYQLFDIDLKLKFLIKGSTLGAVFVIAFLIVGKLTEKWAERIFGEENWVIGAVAAGLMLFALRPLERMAARVADKAMPDTKDTGAYRDFRKMEVYKATVESFLVDGDLTTRERAALDRLRGKLGIAAASAAALERDLISATPA